MSRLGFYELTMANYFHKDTIILLFYALSMTAVSTRFFTRLSVSFKLASQYRKEFKTRSLIFHVVCYKNMRFKSSIPEEVAHEISLCTMTTKQKSITKFFVKR